MNRLDYSTTVHVGLPRWEARLFPFNDLQLDFELFIVVLVLRLSCYGAFLTSTRYFYR